MISAGSVKLFVEEDQSLARVRIAKMHTAQMFRVAAARVEPSSAGLFLLKSGDRCDRGSGRKDAFPIRIVRVCDVLHSVFDLF